MQAPRLEGSRFVALQVYWLLASGSRELPRARNSLLVVLKYGQGCFEQHIEQIHPGSFPGAACCLLIELPTFKAAPLRALATTALDDDENDYELRLAPRNPWDKRPSRAKVVSIGWSSNRSKLFSG